MNAKNSLRVCVLLAAAVASGCDTMGDVAGLPTSWAYGDGSAGSKTVASNEALRDSNMQYGDFTIAAGVTLTVQSGTVIRCTGTFTNNGTIVVASGTEGGLRQGIDASSITGATQPPEPGISTLSAAAGEAGDDTSSRIGGPGGTGISDVEGGGTLDIGVKAGGSGAAGLDTKGGDGGGGFTVLAQTAITNAGEITADGGDGGDGAGGGGGGVIVLASAGSVTNTAGATITADGGDGGTSSSSQGPGGGGGGGLVHFLAPTITDSGAVSVGGGSAGATGAAGSLTAALRTGGGGGGATAGNGGDGGIAPAGANADPGDGQGGVSGFFLLGEFDPTAMF